MKLSPKRLNFVYFKYFIISSIQFNPVQIQIHWKFQFGIHQLELKFKLRHFQQLITFYQNKSPILFEWTFRAQYVFLFKPSGFFKWLANSEKFTI